MKNELFETTQEATSRSAELRARRERKLLEKASAEKSLADNLAAGKEPENLPSLIAGLSAEISGITAALQTVDGAFYKLQRKEKLKDAEHIADRYVEDFKTNTIPELMETIKVYADWLQQDTLASLKGEPRLPDPTSSAINEHGIGSPMMGAILCLNMAMKPRRHTDPTPPADPEELAARPENRLRFGRNARVTNSRGPVQRIDAPSDNGAHPWEIDNDHRDADLRS